MLSYKIVNLDVEIVSVLMSFLQRIPQLRPQIADHEFALDGEYLHESKRPIIIFTNLDTLRMVNMIAPGSLNYYIVVSAHREMAFEAIENGASDFLMANSPFLRFKDSVDKLTGKLIGPRTKNSDKYFFVRNEVRGKLIKINFNEILFVEGAHNYVVIHTGNEMFTVYISLTKMECHLPRDQFSRVHKSFIINDERIRSIERNQVILTCKTVVTLGNSYKEVFLNKLQRNLVLSTKNSAK